MILALALVWTTIQQTYKSSIDAYARAHTQTYLYQRKYKT